MSVIVLKVAHEEQRPTNNSTAFPVIAGFDVYGWLAILDTPSSGDADVTCTVVEVFRSV